MLGLALAVVLCAADAGFDPVVLDVHHGEVYLTTSDGGAELEPTLVPSGTYMDNATTQWVAENKARSRGQASVGPEIDRRTLFWVGGTFFVLGCLSMLALYILWK